MTQAELLALIADRLADNTTGQISEADQREVMSEIVDSFTDADAAISALVDALTSVVATKADDDATTAALAGKRNTADDVPLAEVTGLGVTGRALAEASTSDDALVELGFEDTPEEWVGGYLRFYDDEGVTRSDTVSVADLLADIDAERSANGPDVPVEDGGTGASTPAGAVQNLIVGMASVSLTDGATITPDFATGRNFHVTLAGNRTLANPTNQAAGQSGRILVTQDGTGSRTLAYGANWLFPGGAPTLSTGAGDIDMITYDVHASGTIYATLIKGFTA